MAVAHSVLVIADHVLDRGVAYQELGDDYFQQRQLVRQFERLGSGCGPRFKSWQAHQRFPSSRPPGRSSALAFPAVLPGLCHPRATPSGQIAWELGDR
jgi:hypothetical protein